ncbi:MAG TPA: DUF2231 domain-containing protein [Geminicoccus sp.]|jgi:uncharacterized membrane protein|uniref:DUF2231 domain-containing protein n=1 Tax=Geminicoccus sp. TaxID=2024832 RepID=UPI002E31ABEC|nr:DUF2231 domain-containing protein [Geminicoccus sp.]HEX2525433.1 DUF2231 domain-containing protein [Geminicoccus sp.]
MAQADFDNPVVAEIEQQDVSSQVHVAGHPIHAMTVSFPIALVISTLGADMLFWWSGDPFWARAALWSSFFAFAMGVLAALSGTAELLLVKGIRTRSASWSHAVAAMTLIAIAGANWIFRVGDHEAAVLPVGLFLSLLGSVFVGVTGWHGGKLVFDHGIGMRISNND